MSWSSWHQGSWSLIAFQMPLLMVSVACSTTYQMVYIVCGLLRKLSSWLSCCHAQDHKSLFTGLLMRWSLLYIGTCLSWFCQLWYVSSWRSSLVFGKFLFVSDVWLHSNNLSSIKRLVQSRCIGIVSVVDGDRGCGSWPSSGVNLVMPNHREVWVELLA